PPIRAVPFVAVRNAAALDVTPCTVRFCGAMSTVAVGAADLSTRIASTSVVAPEPVNDAAAEPLNMSWAPAEPEFVLRSSVPLFVRSPPTASRWPSCVPVSALESVPPGEMRMDDPTASVSAADAANRTMPDVPPPMVRLRQAAFALTVTVRPSGTTTASEAVGPTPPGQGAFGVVEVQLPLPAATMAPDVDVAWLPDKAVPSAPSLTGWTVQE